MELVLHLRSISLKNSLYLILDPVYAAEALLLELISRNKRGSDISFHAFKLCGTTTCLVGKRSLEGGDRRLHRAVRHHSLQK